LIGRRPPKSEIWLGIDVGTQGVRIRAYENDGTLVASSDAHRPARAPVPEAMIHEPDADWWGGTREALRPVLAEVSERHIGGIGLAGLFPAVCLMSEAGEAIGSGILYGDGRAGAEVAAVERRLDITLTGDEVAPRLLWLRDRSPTEYRRASVALGPTGFIGFRLTGVLSIDPHSAARWGGIVDATRRGWDPVALKALGIDAGLLPPIKRPHDQIGLVTADAARATGLAEGIPVIAGTTDSLAAMLGDGAMRRGDAMIYYGSSGTLLVCTVDFEDALADQAVFGTDAPYRLAAYALDSGRFLEKIGGALAAGASFPILDAEAAGRPPGSCGISVFPHVSGRLLPPRPAARGAVAGLTLDQTRGDLWRATLESFGFVLMQAQSSLGDPVRSVTAAGGGAVSETWRSIISDMTGWTQEVAPRGGSARGAAFLAAYALGGVRSLSDIREVWLARSGDRPRTVPRSDHHFRYLELLPSWERLDEVLSEATVVSPVQ
jgi:xylulokinase